ncbi:cytochrome P450 4F12-like [Dysidea avara]|uniref:cytochrome P450 4F12-like n=1 Tax=Dysidea avara TaxID=196820 RepID=UPI003331F854
MCLSGTQTGPSLKSLQIMQANHVKYPKFCVYWIGPLIPTVFTANVEIIKMLLRQPGGDNTALTSGTKWRKHRKLLSPAFHSNTIKQYLPVFDEVSHKLLEVWSGLADSGESVEIMKFTNSLTFDVMLRCMCSINSNCLEDKDGSAYHILLRELANLVMERICTPHYALDWMYYFTASGRKFSHYCNLAHEYSEKVIVQRREELLKDDDGKGLTDREIREEVDASMFGGHDTTASALGYTLYCLAMHKKHQELCRKEIREMLVGRDTDAITWEDVSKLSYITMCIKESLRLYPPVPVASRLLANDCEMDGCRIPKGAMVFIGIHTVHHDPLVWDDPKKFDPLRFTTENSKKMDPFAFLPFSAGTRNCMGQQFAMVQMKVAVAHIVNKFLLKMDTTHVVKPCLHLVLKSETGIKLKLSPAMQ